MTSQAEAELPVYQAIAGRIRRDLVVWRHDGKLKLPELDELCRQYGASQMTVKKALGILAEENLIERIQGKGSFIKLTTQSSPNKAFIGIVFPGHSRWHILLDGIQKQLSKNGYRVLKYSYQWDSIDEEILAINTGRRDCAGLVIYPNMLLNDYPLFTRLLAERYPFVLFDSSYDDFADRSIRVRHQEFTAATIERFIAQGARNVALISSYSESVIIKRVNGFRQAVSQVEGISGSCLCLQPGQQEWWRREIRAFLTAGEAPRAALVAGNEALYEIYLAIRELQLRVPEDFRFICYDYVSKLVDLLSPCYSYADYDEYAVGGAVAEKLLDQLAARPATPDATWIDFSIVHRESSLPF